MGHTLIGDLPKTQRWKVVVGLLQQPRLDPSAVARSTLDAAEERLLALRGDPSLAYCFWLLVRLAAAARGPDFVGDAARLGVPLRPDDTALAVVARVAERARTRLNGHPESGPFGELASLALRRALTETVGTQQPSLFDGSLADLERAFRRHSTAAQFGELARRFFGDFFARTLGFYVARALPAQVGVAPGLRTIADSGAFTAALDRHARETAAIVEPFAAAWYLKHLRATGGAIGEDAARRFVAHALDKLGEEWAREGAR